MSASKRLISPVFFPRPNVKGVIHMNPIGKSWLFIVWITLSLGALASLEGTPVQAAGLSGLEAHYAKYHYAYRMAPLSAQAAQAAAPAGGAPSEEGSRTIVAPTNWNQVLSAPERRRRGTVSYMADEIAQARAAEQEAAAPAAPASTGTATVSINILPSGPKPTSQPGAEQLLEYLEERRKEQEDMQPEGVWKDVSEELREYSEDGRIAT